MDKYLTTGRQTQITSTIRGITDSFSATGFQLTFDILDWIEKNIEHRKFEGNEKAGYLHTRTAEQIIKDGFSTGCTDHALVLITFCRAKDLPTKYVELLNRDWLQGESLDPILGHVVGEVNIQGNWYYIDPIPATISTRLPSGMVLYGKGLDTWDLGITNKNWKEKYLDYRRKWQQARTTRNFSKIP